MASLVVVLIVAAIAFTWVRGTRRNRLRWLEKLDLPGVWEREGEFGRLELSGSLHEGRYRFVEGGPEDEVGSWRLEGHELRLTPDGKAEVSYDLRLFQAGKIGIDGPGRERRIYDKARSNVVPLRGRSGG